MGSEVIILPIIFATLFGIVYLFFSTRHKERMSLIEKGADASIFYTKKSKPSSVWKILILSISLLSIGIGAGIILGGILTYSFNVHDGIAMPGSIFLMAGLGLFVCFTIIKKIDKE